MAEFSGIPPLGYNAVIRPAPEAPPPAVPSVEAGQKGGGLSGQAASDGRQPVSDRFARRAEQAKAERADRPGRDEIAGPSPAFRASVLELELDLQNTIARVEAARGKRESDIAAGLKAGTAEQPPAKAERAEEAAPEVPPAEDTPEPMRTEPPGATPAAEAPEADTRPDQPDPPA